METKHKKTNGERFHATPRRKYKKREAPPTYGIKCANLPPILEYPRSGCKLREKSVDVPDDFDKSDLRKIVDHMVYEMGRTNGLGVAAIQISLPLRLFVVRLKNKKDIIVAINPTMTPVDDETYRPKEGCLSLPGVFAKVERFKRVRLEYTDLESRDRHAMETEGTFAHAIQHEMDHLEGVLFIDLLSEYYRKKTTKKLMRRVV